MYLSPAGTLMRYIDSPCPTSLVDSIQDLTIGVSRETERGSGKAIATLGQSLNLLSLGV